MIEKKMTQNETVLYHLCMCRSITALDAIKYYHIMRLSARIADLRSLGLDIASELMTVKTEYGSTTVAKYSLADREAGARVLKRMKGEAS